MELSRWADYETMRATIGVRRRWLASLVMAIGLAAVSLAACGAQGRPPALGQPVQVTLRASSASATLGTATLTPAYGAHIVVYMHGAELPYASPQTPVQLRKGGCYGLVAAPLTGNAPTGGAPVAVRPGATAGADVAQAVDENWYVVVLASAAPDAQVVACGHPLSERRQYFDLYKPSAVDQGVGLGVALLESIVITEVNVTLAAPNAQQPAQWSIHNGSCQGSTIASGAIAAGAASGHGAAFVPLDASSWWLSVVLDGASGQTNCVRAG